jgi:hypothetical protein
VLAFQGRLWCWLGAEYLEERSCLLRASLGGWQRISAGVKAFFGYAVGIRRKRTQKRLNASVVKLAQGGDRVDKAGGVGFHVYLSILGGRWPCST